MHASYFPLPRPELDSGHPVVIVTKMGMGYPSAALHFLSAAMITVLVISTPGDACPASDRDSLLAIKAGLHEPYLGILDSWTGDDCCHNWHGISCNPETNRVADINLRGESEDPIYERAHRTGYMTGTISPAVCNLTGLAILVVADWKGISGPIPPCITSLPYLRIIDLIGNRLTGTVPPDIGRLRELTVLNIGDNTLTGPIPSSIVNLPRLMHLDLRNNRISGHIPADIGRLSMLSRALLSGNQLTGTIPPSFASIYRLADLDLSLNRLSGQLPDIFAKMPVLATLNLDGNMITGRIPASLISSGVSILNLSGNSIEGQIPDAFGPRSYFMELDLSNNRLSGPIPQSIKSAAYIGHVDLAHNQLCGPIPDGAPFDHLDAQCFAGNTCLCGKPLLKSC